MTSPRLEDFPTRRRRFQPLHSVPVLPSLITLGNVFFGFLAICKIADAMRAAAPGMPFSSVVGLLDVAAVLVFVAMVFDALDGRIARMTNQATPFGAQLDSMADMVTFGVAPAFLAKTVIDWHAQDDANRLLTPHPKLYYVAAAVYVLCAALRLARFNVESGPTDSDHKEFKGLPSPAAAAVICGLIALICTRGTQLDVVSSTLLGQTGFDWLVRALPVLLVVLGLLMISHVPYPHALYQIVRQRHSFPFLASLVVLIGVAAVEWQFALAAVTIGYVLWGLGIGCYRMATRGRLDNRDDDDAEFPPLGNPPGQN